MNALNDTTTQDEIQTTPAILLLATNTMLMCTIILAFISVLLMRLKAERKDHLYRKMKMREQLISIMNAYRDEKQKASQPHEGQIASPKSETPPETRKMVNGGLNRLSKELSKESIRPELTLPIETVAALLVASAYPTGIQSVDRMPLIIGEEQLEGSQPGSSPDRKMCKTQSANGLDKESSIPNPYVGFFNGTGSMEPLGSQILPPIPPHGIPPPIQKDYNNEVPPPIPSHGIPPPLKKDYKNESFNQIPPSSNQSDMTSLMDHGRSTTESHLKDLSYLSPVNARSISKEVGGIDQ